MNPFETQAREEIDAFIEKWAIPDYVPHLLDDDDNDGERLRQALLSLHNAELKWAEEAARLDERQCMSDEIDDVVSRHAKNPDLSPIADLKEYMRDSLTAIRRQEG